MEYATRVTMTQAQELFAQGRAIVVSTQRKRCLPVGSLTVRHDHSRTTWAILEATCRAYGLRRQSFYVVDQLPPARARFAAMVERMIAALEPPLDSSPVSE